MQADWSQGEFGQASVSTEVYVGAEGPTRLAMYKVPAQLLATLDSTANIATVLRTYRSSLGTKSSGIPSHGMIWRGSSD